MPTTGCGWSLATVLTAALWLVAGHSADRRLWLGVAGHGADHGLWLVAGHGADHGLRLVAGF